MTPDTTPEILTTAQAAALLQLPPKRVSIMASRKEIPGKKLAGAWRFHRAQLIEFLRGDWPPASQAKPAPRRRGRPPKVLNLDLLESLGSVH